MILHTYTCNMLHTYPRIFEPLHCPVHSLLCPGPGRTHHCRSSAQYLETPCTHVPQSSSLSEQSIYEDVSRLSVRNSINVAAGAHRPSEAGEHVTNIDGEIQTWWPDANLIWNGSKCACSAYMVCGHRQTVNRGPATTFTPEQILVSFSSYP